MGHREAKRLETVELVLNFQKKKSYPEDRSQGQGTTSADQEVGLDE